jgi:nitroreductase
MTTDVSTAIEGRRSIRSYRSEAVSDEAMAKILHAGQMAPSAGNLQGRNSSSSGIRTRKE